MMRDVLLEKALRNGGPPQGTVQVYALSLWKCLQQPCVARSLDDDGRAAAFLHNYQAMLQMCKAAGLRRLCGDDLYLWRSGEYLISVKTEHVITNEGELTLHFRRGGQPLYGCTFSFVPGYLADLPDPTVLLLSRMQGVGNRAEAIRQATRDCGDITPQSSLYHALLGLARTMGFGHIVGVAAENQVCFSADHAEAFRQAYDGFYATVGGERLGSGFFRLPVEPVRRSLWDMTSSHRRRTRRKREAKDALAQAVATSWRGFTAG